MGDERKSKLRLEIAHVLFIDIVGYSKLRINEQSAQIEKLREIVRGTEQFRAAEAEGKLLRLPTGDGGALAFRNSPEAPVICAEAITKALKNHPEIRVRMGVHSGPVNEVTDLNEQANIAGAGINTAQRIMDCGDAGHILVSKHAAEDLVQAQLGDIDSAIAALPHLLEVPNGETCGGLQTNPLWDPLRKDPRFQKLCAGK
jgi:class 3 adenylate cyclase